MTEKKPRAPYNLANRPNTVYTLETLLARTVEEGDCMLWTGYICNGVPRVRHDGVMCSVRRLVLEFRGKTFAPGDNAACTCGNSACVAPAHAVKHSQAQHASAMAKAPARKSILRSARLAANARLHRAKLTIEQVREIRCSEEMGKDLAARFGVNPSLISKIRRNQTWREFSGPFAGLGAQT